MMETKDKPKGYTAPKEHFVYRVKFTKGEEVKFIGHLDLMRMFQRSIKRAGLPVAYSNGFNPHQILSFASPLTLGTTSEGEYGDFEMAEKVEPSSMVEKLNETLPTGFRVRDAVLIQKKTESAMAAIQAAEYEVFTEESVTPEMIEKYLPSFLAQDEILAMKKTKKKTKEVDIRPDIFEMKNISENGQGKIYLYLAAGSQKNLKPDVVMDSFYQFVGLEFPKYKIQYKRLELYRKEGERLVGLSEEIGIRTLNGAESNE